MADPLLSKLASLPDFLCATRVGGCLLQARHPEPDPSIRTSTLGRKTQVKPLPQKARLNLYVWDLSKPPYR